MSSAATIPHSFRPGTARAALAYRDFRFIWFGLFLSSIGTWMQNFTLPAYIEHRTGSAALVGLLVFMQLGPLLVLSIPASARRAIPAAGLPRHDAADPDGVQRRPGGARGHRLAAVDAVRRLARHRNRQRA